MEHNARKEQPLKLSQTSYQHQNKLLPKEVCQDTNRTKQKENLHLKVGTGKKLDIVQMKILFSFHSSITVL